MFGEIAPFTPSKKLVIDMKHVKEGCRMQVCEGEIISHHLL